MDNDNDNESDSEYIEMSEDSDSDDEDNHNNPIQDDEAHNAHNNNNNNNDNITDTPGIEPENFDQEVQEDLETVYEADAEDEDDEIYIPESDEPESEEELHIETVNEEDEPPNRKYKTKSGRVVNSKGYLNYEPDFNNTKYESSSANVDSELSNDDIMGIIFEQSFGQYNLNEGLRRFGNKGSEAVLGELKQLHQRDAFLPRYVNELTHEENCFNRRKTRWENQKQSSCRWSKATHIYTQGGGIKSNSCIRIYYFDQHY